MKLTFLGTSGMIPTSERNLSGILLTYRDETILIDCGEGIQRQLRIAGVRIPSLTRVFITHWHGDHFFGLPGLIENLFKNHYHGTLQLYGPQGTKKNFERISEAMFLRKKLQCDVHEIKNAKTFVDTKTFTLHAAPLKHSAPCLGLVFQEKDCRKIHIEKLQKLGIPEGPHLGQLQKGKDLMWKGKKVKAKDVTFVERGKKVVFLLDTTTHPNCLKLAKDADVLICDSTFQHDLIEKAHEYQHLTSVEAAQIAKKAKAKKLILTHFSQRYKDVSPLVADARKVFPETYAATDFAVFEVT